MPNFSRNFAVFTALCCCVIAGQGAESARLAVQSATRGAYLVRTDTGERVILNGVNYIRLRSRDHATFEAATAKTAAHYDPKAAEAMLAHLAATGHNCVRVFVMGRNATNPGMGAGNPGELHGPYLDNVADFLRRAATHHIWVVPTLGDGELPFSWQKTYPTGNRIYLTPEGIAAKQQYLRLLLQGLRQRGADLLANIAFLELQNELVLELQQWPFDQASGSLRGPDGHNYDLRSDDDRRALVVNSLRIYHQTCVATIKSIDPKMLVGEGIYTWAAAGVKRVWRLPPKVTHRKQPPLASDLLFNGLDILDIHLYSRAANQTTAEAVRGDLENTGFLLPEARSALSKIPVLLGEFGSYKNTDATFTAAIERSKAIRSESLRHGFTAGALFWTYDSFEQAELWPAMTDWSAYFATIPPLTSTNFPQNGPKK